MRVVRFARAVGKIERCADIGHESLSKSCFPNNAASVPIPKFASIRGTS
jgi:hypothetical protein